MVKSNSFSATHPDLNELKNKLVELADPDCHWTIRVASTDVAWWHRIGESGKPTRSSMGGLLFRLGKADQLLGHGHGAGRRARKLQHSGGSRSGTRARLAARLAALRGTCRERLKVTRQQGRAHLTHGLPLRTRRAQSKIKLRACRLPLKRLFSRH
jgi:hypothetical protein